MATANFTCAGLIKALEEAVSVARACQAMIDEQGNRYFRGEKPNWKKAALACHDEIADKADRWSEALQQVDTVVSYG